MAIYASCQLVICTHSGAARLTKITEVLVLQVRLILVRGDIGIIGGITLGETLVPALVGNHKGQAEQQDNHDLRGQLVATDCERSLQLTSAIREAMQTVIPVL